MDDTRSSDSRPALPCQTLAQAGLTKFYTPRHSNDAVYESDLAWFLRHKSPKRRWSIRQTMGDEIETRRVMTRPPMLWVLVNEPSPGFHLVLPMWRGSPFFRVCTFKYVSIANVSSDAEIAAILDECFRRGGFDKEAMLRWEAQFPEASEPQRALTGPSWGR